MVACFYGWNCHDIDVMKLFDIANKKNVAFVPGAPFI